MKNPTATRSSRRGNTGKILISLGAVGAAAAVAGLGTFGSFASTTSGSQAVTAGTVVIGLSSSAGTGKIGVEASNVVPGDTIQRAVTLANTGSSDLAAVNLTTTASPSSLLDTDTTNGLKLKIESCPVAWTAVAPTTAPTYTCSSGTITTVLASQAVIGANAAITPTNAKAHGGTDYLRVTLTLPATAGDTFQGAASTINFAFTGSQRVAGNS